MHEPIMAIHALVLLEHAYVAQLAVQHPLRDRRLRDICPVEVVHTIRAHDAELQLHELWPVRILIEVPDGRYRTSVNVRTSYRETRWLSQGGVERKTNPFRRRSCSMRSKRRLIRSQRMPLHSVWKSK